MRINFKQTVAKLFSFYGTLAVLLAGLIILFSFSTSFAPTKMSDSELSDVEAQSLLSVIHYTGSAAVDFRTDSYWTGSQDVIRIKLGLDIEVSGHVRNQKLGYYTNSTGRTGWDQDTTNQFIGTPDRSTPLSFKGMYLDLGFDNFTTPSTRKLNYVEIGTMTCSGQVTGSVNTTSSLLVGGTGTNNGVLLRQTATGRATFFWNSTLLSFVFATKYSYQAAGDTRVDNLEGIFQKLPQFNSNNKVDVEN